MNDPNVPGIMNVIFMRGNKPLYDMYSCAVKNEAVLFVCWYQTDCSNPLMSIKLRYVNAAINQCVNY